MHILLLACTRRYYVFIYLFTKYVCIYKPGIKFLGGSAGKWCLYERIYSTSTRRVYNVSK